MDVVWNRHEPSHYWMSPLGEKRQQRYERDYIHSERGVVLQEILVPAQWQAYKHPIGNTGKDLHHSISHRNVFPSGSVNAKGLVDDRLDLVNDRRKNAIHLSGEVLVDNMLMVNGANEVWIGKSVISLQQVIMSCPHARHVV